jgi:hypothetical protein
MMVRICLYNTNGQLIKDINKGLKQADRLQVKIDGSRLSSGVFLLRLESSAGVLKAKLML